MTSSEFIGFVFLPTMVPALGASSGIIEVDDYLDDWCIDIPGRGHHDPEDWAPGLEFGMPGTPYRGVGSHACATPFDYRNGWSMWGTITCTRCVWN